MKRSGSLNDAWQADWCMSGARVASNAGTLTEGCVSVEMDLLIRFMWRTNYVRQIVAYR